MQRCLSPSAPRALRAVAAKQPKQLPQKEASARIVVVGGVAGGATAATRARRVNENCKITMFEKGPYVSFANCGLPYFIGDDVKDRGDLLLSSPELFHKKYDIDVHTGHEVLSIDRQKRLVRVRDLAQGNEMTEPYDALILAPGASALRPASIPNISARNIFTLKTVPDADALHALLDLTLELEAPGHRPKAVVVGAGFIGLETAEAFKAKGCDVTVVEMAPQILPPFDADMAAYVEHHLQSAGIDLCLDQRVCDFVVDEDDADRATGVTLASGTVLPCDIVVLSLGVSAETRLAREAGLPIGERTGGIQVDSQMRSLADERIFCVGDAVETKSRITGLPNRFQLAGPAQKQGRVAGTNAGLLVSSPSDERSLARDEDILPGPLQEQHVMHYGGALGTCIVSCLGAVAGMTGLTERGCADAGIDYNVAVTHPLSHVAYVPGGKFMHIKMLLEKKTCRILGVQVVGLEGGGVARRVDVIATAIMGGLSCQDLEGLDLCYSPHHGAANDPIAVAGFVASNMYRGQVEHISLQQYKERFATAGENDHVLLDVRDRSEFEARHLTNSLSIPLTELRERLNELPSPSTGIPIVTTCRVGLTAYSAARLLKGYGFADVLVLSGGITTAHGRMHPDDSLVCCIPTHAHLQ